MGALHLRMSFPGRYFALNSRYSLQHRWRITGSPNPDFSSGKENHGARIYAGGKLQQSGREGGSSFPLFDDERSWYDWDILKNSCRISFRYLHTLGKLAERMSLAVTTCRRSFLLIDVGVFVIQVLQRFMDAFRPGMPVLGLLAVFFVVHDRVFQSADWSAGQLLSQLRVKQPLEALFCCVLAKCVF